MLPSLLIKIYSIVVAYFLWHSCDLLAKIPRVLDLDFITLNIMQYTTQ